MQINTEFKHEDAEPSIRYLGCTNAFSEKGKTSILNWVRSSIDKWKHKDLDSAPINSFINHNPADWFAISTQGCYGELGLPQQYDTVFSATERIQSDQNIKIIHWIWQYGIPLKISARGHRHIACIKGRIENFPLLNAMPKIDDINDEFHQLHTVLCNSEDFKKIIQGLPQPNKAV